MKIGIDCHTLEIKNWAGKEHYLYSLLEQFRELDRKDNYYLYFRHSVFKDSFWPSNWKIKSKNLSTPFWHIYVLWRMATDGIETFFSPCTFLLPALNFFISQTIVIYDLTAFLPEIKRTHKQSVRMKEKLFIKLALTKAKNIIAISQSTKDDLIKLFNVKPEKIKVIYGAAQQRFRLINDDVGVKGVLDKYNITGKYIFFTGTLEPRKNLIRLIEAYNDLRINYKINDYKLVLAGKKGWYYEEIFKKVEELGLAQNVIFAGYVADDDLPCLYNAASLFVYISLYEGFGLPVVEALSCGCPVITSNISSMPEVAGRAAKLVNPNDISQISRAMFEILSNEKLADEMRQKGMAQASEFSWAKSAKQFIDIITFKKLI